MDQTEADYISNSASSETQLSGGELRSGLHDQIVTWIEDALVSLNETLASFGEKGKSFSIYLKASF